MLKEKEYKKRKRLEHKRKKHEKKKFKFTDKTHPIKGIISFLCGLAALTVMIALCILTGNTNGKGSVFIGLAGFLAMLLAAAGVVLALMAIRQKEIHYRFPAAGGILSGILLFSYLALYILGTVS